MDTADIREMTVDFEHTLPSGVPSLPDYRALTSSKWFKSIEAYSNDFLRRNSEPLAEYCRKWVRDPLHQWSRQWEYPYAISRILTPAVADSADSRGPAILDAGSGVTFLPYYLAEHIPSASVTCSDYDAAWADIFRNLNQLAAKPVAFVANDLRELRFPDESFDVVYCISVLEHTNAYATIAREFRRILRPGGSLIVTFDISIDGDADIPAAGAEQLLDALFENFPDSKRLDYSNLDRRVREVGIVTTRAIADLDRELLPWASARPSRLRRFLHLPSPSIGRNLTFFCHTFRG